MTDSRVVVHQTFEDLKEACIKMPLPPIAFRRRMGVRWLYVAEPLSAGQMTELQTVINGRTTAGVRVNQYKHDGRPTAIQVVFA